MKLKDLIPSAQARALASDPSLARKVKAPSLYAPYKSKLERDYSIRLETLQRAGEILWWAYEPWRLRIASGKKQAYYRPDFVIVSKHYMTRFVEVKGFWRTADRLRLKVAAGLFNYHTFVAVTREGGEWKEEAF